MRDDAEGRARRPVLKDVTVVAADCVRPDLAARALELSLARCEFADAVLYSDVTVAGRFRSEIIAPLRSLADYTAFCLRDLPSRIATGFMLIVQWDGYVVDAGAWSRDFTRYDYIGALTPAVSGGAGRWIVGNGGFSLRSRKLLALTAALPMVPGVPEDYLISETFRAELERAGVRFAPPEVAARFSFGQRRSPGPTFGFHGVENFHRVEDDATALALFDRLTPAEREEGRMFPPIVEALKDGRDALALRVFERARAGHAPARVRAMAGRVLGSDHEAAAMLGRLAGLPDA